MPAPLSFAEFSTATPEDWRAAAEPFLKGAPFEKKLVTRTPEGISIQPIAFPESRDRLDQSWPGQPPFTRGAHAPGRRVPLIAQEIPVGDPATFNRILLDDLMGGGTATSILLDTATRRARDPDECAPDEVGQCGVSISTLEDLTTALADVDLESAPLLVWPGASALPFLALLGGLINDRNADASTWRGSVLADPLTEWARDGELTLPLPDAWDELAEGLRWATRHFPQLRLIGVQANLWADAGGSAVHELAFALATGTESLRELGTRGIDIDTAAPRVQFGLSLDSHVLMQIAKLRAARRLWTHVVEAFGGDASRAPLAIHARTSTFNKSTLDPHTNILRAAGEAFAGMVGGVDSLHVAAFDEPCRAPDAFSRRIARNIPIILAEECGLLDVADPAGGSWSIESLTDSIAHAAWSEFQAIESLGGMTEAIRQGVPQRAVSSQAEARTTALASGREHLVGVNLSPNPAETPLSDRRLEGDPVRSTEVRSRRADSNFRKIPDLASAIQAVLDGASLGQIRRALPRSQSSEIAIDRVRVRSLASGFQSLRDTATDWRQRTGKPLQAWLATFGPPSQHRARAEFSSGFLASGGFEVRSGKAASTPAEAAASAIAADAPVVVICSSDDTYPTLVPPFARALKAARPSAALIVAGAPGEHEADLRAAGVDEFIHLRSNRLAVLEDLFARLSVCS